MTHYVEMRTDLGRTFGIEIVHNKRRYLFAKEKNRFYEDIEGIPEVKDEELIKDLRNAYESRK